ncbi:helix-hairpin-helix domain-containing protein [Cellulomonas palmilytica]|nr:helix-hairpin-helix domain-containing protein [Cellulomonas palmilytica]
MLPGPERAPTRVRWRPSVRTALAGSVAIVLVAGAVALRTVVTQPGEPVDLPVPAPLTAAPATPSGAAGSAGVEADGSASQAPQEVVVDVAGAVTHPGVVRLPVGARVVDAIDAAGGATADADLARLNLARVLVDAEQVLVPRPGDPLPVGPSPGSGAATGAGAGDDLVDLNAADAAALETLPGIGPVLAERIVEHRADRPFSSVDELVDVPGIGTALLERLRDRVRV